MPILPRADLIRQVQEKYTDEFLADIFSKLGISDAAQKSEFSKIITMAGASYLTFIENNQNRLQPSAQKKLLDNLSKAFIKTQQHFDQVYRDNPARTKFSETILKAYPAQDAQMQEMLAPYHSAGGYSHEIFSQMLGFMAEMAEQAKTAYIGDDSAPQEKSALYWWIAIIGHAWPKESPVNFQIGEHTAPARGILVKLMGELDHIDDTAMKTAMRNMLEKKQLKHPAEYLLN